MPVQKTKLGKVASKVKSAGGFLNRTLARLTGAGIRGESRLNRTQAKWSGRGSTRDWRVRLDIPQGSPLEGFFFDNNPLMMPLRNESGGGGMFWPLTPSMVIQHTASYNAMEQVHSNYPHYAYENSQVDQFNIIGEFPVQNSDDARHWVATINFLRTATKMFFGSEQGLDGLKGNPPPILHLSGYGDHMFNKVPVILKTFNVELRSGIDYISTSQSDVYRTNSNVDKQDFDYQRENPTWAPTISLISVLVTPIYSRNKVRDFSMYKFVRGQLNGKGTDEVGFI